MNCRRIVGLFMVGIFLIAMIVARPSSALHSRNVWKKAFLDKEVMKEVGRTDKPCTTGIRDIIIDIILFILAIPLWLIGKIVWWLISHGIIPPPTYW